MKPRYLILLIIVSLAGGAITNYYWQLGGLGGGAMERALAKAREAHTPTEMVGQPLPAFTLHNLQGEAVSSEQFEGKVLLLNFWAAWCPPCRREIPGFAEVWDFYHESGFEVIGIAIDDQQAVEEFLQKMPQVKYPQMIGDADAIAFGGQLGNKNGNLPYSVLVDAQGIIRFVKYGELEKIVLIEKLEPLLRAEEI